MKFKRGEPFEAPEHPDECELYIGFFFGRIRAIVAKENHIHKWDNVDRVIDMLYQAADEIGVNVDFDYDNGEWFISGFDSKEDFQNLPAVAKAFGKIYRHQTGSDRNNKLKFHDGKLSDVKEFKEILDGI